ncbi:four helix bundle protein [Flaviaesturariibacter amylovorans]|uniref:Four helix bundle protein n=1 Tax=Flaviaesturariibacter amylovorans TaxID=1084520 RepID=A0ABP8G8X4_9BACT
MATFKRFEEIIAWQLAHQLCREIGRIARETGLAKDYKLREQVCDSSNSIMNNIAEGFGRTGNREFIGFLHIAHASCSETQSQLYTLHDRKYITPEEFDVLNLLAHRTSKAIYSLIGYLERSEIRGLRYRSRG